MNKASIIGLTTIFATVACILTAPNGRSYVESPVGTITNSHGETLFISENATDRGATLQEAVQAGIRLRGASLHGMTLRDINLTGADLSSADFRGSTLEDVDLSSADLSGSHFEGARFSRVLYKKAKLGGSTLAKASVATES